MDMVALLKVKNVADITQKELDAFRLEIEEAVRYVDKLQNIHRSLTGQHYVHPIRL